ncbi:MAG: hypothetical protein IJP70_03525 [Bacteroidales bacterium]|nr:hypothetical protein [Bacteroidales bacterium]
MKKYYQKPNSQVVTIQTNGLLAASYGPGLSNTTADPNSSVDVSRSRNTDWADYEN